MKIVSIKHKGIKLFVEKNNPKLLPQQHIRRIQRLLRILIDLEDIHGFLTLARGKPHKLKGNRKNTYSISVYASWRLTFEYRSSDKSIHILNFEDYH